MVAMSQKQFSDETTKNSPILENVKSDLKNLGSFTKEELCVDLCKFITVVKKLDGSDFPPRTLYDNIICILFWLESQGFNWRLVSGGEFEHLKYTLDNCMKDHAVRGIGNSVHKAQVLTFTDKDLLWSLGLLGSHNPQVLLDTVIVKLGLTCALCAGKEQRSLRSIPFRSQFQLLHDSEGNVECKSVDVHCISDIDRCPVRLFLTYLSKLPKKELLKHCTYNLERSSMQKCGILINL